MTDTRDLSEEKPPESPKPRGISVVVVGTRGETALVEWLDGDMPVRGYVPAKEVKDGAISVRVQKAAVPYGVAWSKVAKGIALSPEDIQRALRQHGIWTVEDTANVGTVVRFLKDVFQWADMLREANRKG